MRFRRVISLTLLLGFAVLITTSVILYVVPQGRVAYWSGWTLWGFTKTEWTYLHINLGVLLLLGAIFHVYLNWKPIVAYMRNRSRRLIVLTGEFIVAGALCVVFVLGTLYAVPPLNWVLDLNEWFKADASATYGEPPYGHAEQSALNTFARRLDLDLEDAAGRLRSAGLQLDSLSQTLEEIAAINHTTPQRIYEAMLPEVTGPRKMPGVPPPGTGRRALNDLCEDYALSVTAVIDTLRARGIAATEDLTLLEIAERNDVRVDQIYEAIERSAAGEN